MSRVFRALGLEARGADHLANAGILPNDLPEGPGHGIRTSGLVLMTALE